MRYELRKKEKELRRQRKLLESELQRESAEMADGECSGIMMLVVASVIFCCLWFIVFLPYRVFYTVVLGKVGD